MPSRQTSCLALLSILLSASCTPKDRAQRIVDAALLAHGSHVLEGAKVEFDFRGKRYGAVHDEGLFAYTRVHSDSNGTFTARLDNQGLSVALDGIPITEGDPRLRGVESNVNSVVYFALLPHKLNDQAVIKEYLGTETILDREFDVVQVTFRKEGGGIDYQDRFVYWFDRTSHTISYLAYYFVTNGGGTRFRQAINTRRVSGLLVSDYRNYRSDSLGDAVELYGRAFSAGELDLVSEIRLTNVTVRDAGSD